MPKTEICPDCGDILDEVSYVVDDRGKTIRVLDCRCGFNQDVEDDGE